MKICTVCHLEKKIEDFTILKTVKSGRAARCKKCAVEYNRNKKNKDPESYLKKQSTYRKKHYEINKEKILISNKIWRDKNIEKVKLYQKEYAKQFYLINKEKIYQRNFLWRCANKEKVNAISKKWKINNQEQQKKYKKEYWEKNREKEIYRNRVWKKQNVEASTESSRIWKEKNKNLVRIFKKNYNMKYPEKVIAVNSVHYALKIGKLIRPTTCSQCLIECKPEGHHPDYNKPLEVIWLCKKCHITEHKKCKAVLHLE